MIDFHSHIIPKVDDGSNSTNQSIRMLKMLKANNVETVIATPHFYLKDNTIEEFLVKIDYAYNKLIKKIDVEDNLPHILRGAEVLLTSEIASLQDLEKLCIEGTRYILLEMPYTYWSDWVYQAIDKIIVERNLIPIIAHVERYTPIIDDPNKMLRLLSFGVIAQINAPSIVEHKLRKLSLKLIENNMVHVIGSDTHNDMERAPNILKAYEIISKKFGDETADYFDNNAKSILQNKELDIPSPDEIKKFLGIFL